MIEFYSTCRDCKTILHVTTSETVHPLCTEQPTHAEKLAADWLAMVDNWHPQQWQVDELADVIDKCDEAAPRLAEAAEIYASWGWPVFPLSTHTKIPAIPKAKGGNGVNDATTSVDRIRAHWTKHPTHNIGIATGAVFDVLDIDPSHGGAESYLRLLAYPNVLKCHGLSTTASGGMHLLFDPRGHGNGLNLHELPGVDWRGRGGYIVAPPSTLGKRGRSWSWTHHPSPLVKRHNSFQTVGRQHD